MKPRIIEVRVNEALSRSRLPDIDYAFNPYMGCWHACSYCYARLYTRIKEVSANWGSIIAVKTNIVDVLRREARTKPRGVVGVGTITDAYQPLEALYKLTRRSIEVLLNYGFQVSIQTKNPLVLRDLELLEERRRLVDIGVTITSLEPRKARIFEPRAPSPKARVRILEEASARGIETWVFMGPIIPGYNDDDETIEELVVLAKETNSILYYDKLRVKSFMLNSSSLLYEIAVKARRYDWTSLYSRVKRICRRHGVVCRPGFEYGSEQANSIVAIDKYLGMI